MGKENTKHIKLAIASKAAELISQEGIRDYHFAKKKAAKYLGFSDKEVLPSNNEIDKELILDRKSTRLNSSHSQQSRMPSSA